MITKRRYINVDFLHLSISNLLQRNWSSPITKDESVQIGK